MNRLHLPDKRIIADDYISGVKASDISAKYKVSLGYVYGSLHSRNVKLRGVLSGPQHPQWKGGTKDVHGYHIVGGKKEHRVIAARLIGRELFHWETAHHVDANRLNNADSNIVVMPEREHQRFHTFLRHRGLAVTRDHLEAICRQETQYYFRFTTYDVAPARDKFPLQHGNSLILPKKKVCRVRKCGKKACSRHLCSMHYQRKMARLRGYWLSGGGRKTVFKGIYTRTNNMRDPNERVL